MTNYDRYSPSFKRDPYPVHDQMREHDPIYKETGFGGAPVWIVTSYDFVAEVLRDHRRFVKRWQSTLSPEQLAQVPTDPIFECTDKHLLNLDPPDHTRIRGLVSQVFTVGRVEKLRPRISQIADDLMCAFINDGNADLVDAFASPLPIFVIAELLGVPATDRDQFRRWSHTAITPAANEQHAAARLNQLVEFLGYLGEMFRLRKQNPQNDLISALLAVEEDGDKLTMNELYAMITILLIGGHESTSNMIANAMLVLLQHPQELARLKADPNLIPQAIEELLRYDTSVEHALRRFVAEDMTFHGHAMRKGETVVAVIGAANRDPKHFGCPAELDFDREPNKHISFGKGIHYCIGASLARAELDIALTALVTRLSNMRLAVPVESLVWHNNPTIRGVEKLPVTWTRP